MFQSSYQLKISGKDTKRFIRNLMKSGIYFENICFEDEHVIVIVNEKNYQKIKETKTIYKIQLEKVFGFIYLKSWIKQNFYFILNFFLSIILLLCLSQVIFEVEVVHSKKEIRDFLKRELKQHGIKPFNKIVSYNKKEKIKDLILEENKDTLEWIEIDRVGVKYYIRVEERIKKEEKEEVPIQNIVAKKDGIILKIESSSGEIVKTVNSYVRKGDIIISGEIKKNDEVVDKVGAIGKVYAEVWYQVNVSLPKNYYEEYKTGKNSYALMFNFLNKKYSLIPKKTYKNYNEEAFYLIDDPFHLLQLYISKQEEIVVIDKKYNGNNSMEEINKIAREKMEEFLGTKGEVIMQKNLKITEKDSTIVSTVFFKVCEDITDVMEIKEETKKEEQ